MARYLVKATMFTDRIVEAGEEIEFDGKVRDEDRHLELISTAENKKSAQADAKATDDAVRADAVKAKLTEDGKTDGKPIDKDTPMEIVEQRLADYKSANPFV